MGNKLCFQAIVPILFSKIYPSEFEKINGPQRSQNVCHFVREHGLERA